MGKRGQRQKGEDERRLAHDRTWTTDTHPEMEGEAENRIARTKELYSEFARLFCVPISP